MSPEAVNGVLKFKFSWGGGGKFRFKLKPPPFEKSWIRARDAIHNFKWVKIIQILQNRGQLFSNIAD